MATTNTTNGIQLQSGVPYTRVFYFGTTGQTVVVNISKNGGNFAAAQNSPATEIGSNWYKINLTAVDTNTIGDLAYHCTAGAGGPAEFNDQVVSQIYQGLAVDGGGRILIASNARQGQPLNLPFTMTSGGAPKPGLNVSCQRNFGSGFSAIAGLISELGNGAYMALLQSSDTNAVSAIYRFNAQGADDNDVIVIFTP